MILRWQFLHLYWTPDDDRMVRFCENFAKLQQCIEGRTFSILPDCQDAHGLELKDIALRPLWIWDLQRYTRWLEVFFRSIESLVVAHSLTVTNPFGTIDIPTGDSITDAVGELLLGYRDVLLRLHFFSRCMIRRMALEDRRLHWDIGWKSANLMREIEILSSTHPCIYICCCWVRCVKVLH